MSNFVPIFCEGCGEEAVLNAYNECQSCYNERCEAEQEAPEPMQIRHRFIPDTPSLSDYKNEAGEWMASPEQIRADMSWEPDPADFYDDY